MKWKCTYQPEEQEEVMADLDILQLRHPHGKIHAGGIGQVYLKTVPGEIHHMTPCDLCRHGPLSSCGGKPCAVCPAESRVKE